MHVEYHISQGLNFPGATARRSYYVGYFGAFGTPTVFFNGGDKESGGGNEYNRYRAHIVDELAAGSPLMVNLSGVFDGSSQSGSLTVDLEVASGETIPLPGECLVRAVLFEDEVDYCCGYDGVSTWHRVARAVLGDRAFTISSAGEQQQVVWNFALDPAWDPAHLKAVAFVQRDSDASILNSDFLLSAATEIRPAETTAELKLWPSAPNPFRTTTEFRFSLPARGHARLVVYDVRGRRVAQLADGEREEGEHRIVWNGTDGAGERVASGVYLYRLDFAGQSLLEQTIRLR